ncbi:MAG: MmgE/PrpD family protein [Pseudomonadota bacterium]
MKAASALAAGLSAAERIAGFAAGFDPASLTGPQRQLCGRSLADTWAVAFAGRDEPAPTAALRYLREASLLRLADAGQGGSAALWGRDERAAPEIAAWWNGVAGHVLDYDDVTVPMRGHPSVVLWPALLALGEARDLPGERVVAAFVVGMEVICKLSRAMALEHYARGWHSTASIGVVGSTAACAYLLQLDARQTTHALGLAVAQAAGTRENVGTEAKSFQAGHANGAAVRAASLAAAGFMAGEHALDGPHGYLQLYADGVPADAALDGLGQAPLEIERSGLDVKQYPMCYATHRALDAVLDLRAAHGLRLEDVVHAAVLTSRGALEPLVHPRPATGLEGKFSLAYALGAALADGAVRLTSFTDAAVRRPEIQQFFDRVSWREAEGAAVPRWTELTLRLRSGQVLHQRVEGLRGSAQKPVSDTELATKLDDCLHWGVRTRSAQAAPAFDGQALLQRCLALPGLSTRAWLASLAFSV